jgi:hypothetical protein
MLRDRILGFLAEVVTEGGQHLVPLAPHLRELNRREAEIKTAVIDREY